MKDYRNIPSAARHLVFVIFSFWRFVTIFLNKYKVWINNYNCSDRGKESGRMVNVAQYVWIVLQKTEPIIMYTFRDIQKRVR